MLVKFKCKTCQETTTMIIPDYYDGTEIFYALSICPNCGEERQSDTFFNMDEGENKN